LSRKILHCSFHQKLTTTEKRALEHLKREKDLLAGMVIFLHCFVMVKRSQIRAFSKAVAQRFRPRKIVLFGSYAYGNPTEDSDVDLLVIMPRTYDRGERMSVRIRQAIPRDFPLDLLVRTPADLARRLGWKDPFICELLEKGKVLYEANDA
jgi:predicted nucleotidyltransferase